MIGDEYPKAIDTSLYEGKQSSLPLHYKFNTLRGLISDKCNECWSCSKLSSCNTIQKIFKCGKVKFITDKLNKDNFL